MLVEFDRSSGWVSPVGGVGCVWHTWSLACEVTKVTRQVRSVPLLPKGEVCGRREEGGGVMGCISSSGANLCVFSCQENPSAYAHLDAGSSAAHVRIGRHTFV